MVYSDGVGVHRTLYLSGTPLYAALVDTLDLWAIVKAFPRPYYTITLSEADPWEGDGFSVEIASRTPTEWHGHPGE